MSGPIQDAQRRAPRHWAWVPLKRAVDINQRVLGEDSDPDYVFRYIDIGAIDVDGRVGEMAEFRFGEAPSRARRIVQAGDVIVSTVRTYLRAIARIPSFRDEAICSTGFAVLTARREVEAGFLYWWARGSPFVEEVVARSVGVGYPAVAPDELGRMPIPIPPRHEQQAIGVYLDREAARIDSIIQRCEKLIALVEIRFWSLVSLATHSEAILTGRAPQSVSMPWRRVPLRRCFTRIDYGIGERSSDIGRFPVLGMGQVGRGKVSDIAEGFLDSAPADLLLEAGDLLFNRTNSLPLVGKVGIFRGRAGTTTFASYLVRLRTRPYFDANFLNYLLNTDEVLGLARSMALPSIGQANLNPNRYSQIRIWAPDIGEQRTIAAGLGQAAAEVDRTRAMVKKQIELLRERRQALITAAVTGQVDVSEPAA